MTHFAPIETNIFFLFYCDETLHITTLITHVIGFFIFHYDENFNVTIKNMWQHKLHMWQIFLKKYLITLINISIWNEIQ